MSINLNVSSVILQEWSRVMKKEWKSFEHSAVFWKILGKTFQLFPQYLSFQAA